MLEGSPKAAVTRPGHVHRLIYRPARRPVEKVFIALVKVIKQECHQPRGITRGDARGSLHSNLSPFMTRRGAVPERQRLPGVVHHEFDTMALEAPVELRARDRDHKSSLG
jgi:hypothetical protein